MSARIPLWPFLLGIIGVVCFGFLFASLVFGIRSDVNVLAATLGGVLGGGALAVSAQEVWTFVRRPRLALRADHDDPACEATTPVVDVVEGKKIEGKGRWLRLKVINEGWTPAFQAEVLLVSISNRKDLGTSASSEKFSDTLPLFWSVRKKQTKMNILPGVNYSVDCLYLREIGGEFTLGILTPSTPYRYQEILSNPGSLELRFVICAENSAPVHYSAKAKWSGGTEPLTWQAK